MASRIFNCAIVPICVFLLMAALPASADDPKNGAPALSGVWSKKDGDLKIEFAEKDVVKIAPHGDSALAIVVCSYTVAKEKLVKVKVTGFGGNEEARKHLAEVVPVGTEFSFKWKAKDDNAKLDELKCDKVALLKSHLEGDYEQKK